MISLFPEFKIMYARYIPEELINLYLIYDLIHGLVFLNVFMDYDPEENCHDYDSEFLHSGIQPPTFKDPLELKGWFLEQPIETHIYSTNVFPDCYTPDLINEGYVYIDSYDGDADIPSEILNRFQEPPITKSDLKKGYRYIEKSLANGLLKIKKGCAGSLLFTKDGDKFRRELLSV
jgi:hypothetical protein